MYLWNRTNVKNVFKENLRYTLDTIMFYHRLVFLFHVARYKTLQVTQYYLIFC